MSLPLLPAPFFFVIRSGGLYFRPEDTGVKFGALAFEDTGGRKVVPLPEEVIALLRLAEDLQWTFLNGCNTHKLGFRLCAEMGGAAGGRMYVVRWQLRQTPGLWATAAKSPIGFSFCTAPATPVSWKLALLPLDSSRALAAYSFRSHARCQSPHSGVLKVCWCSVVEDAAAHKFASAFYDVVGEAMAKGDEVDVVKAFCVAVLELEKEYTLGDPADQVLHSVRKVLHSVLTMRTLWLVLAA